MDGKAMNYANCNYQIGDVTIRNKLGNYQKMLLYSCCEEGGSIVIAYMPRADCNALYT